VRIVAVGGATLGGSGKTPLAIACARALYDLGARVALVGHAYHADPGGARVVTADDRVVDVGDEALLAATALRDTAIPVVVASRRALAVARASHLADVLVVDGLVQCHPRATLALLAVDAIEPWGRAGATPPCGDLRAPREALLAACDRIVSVGDTPADAAVESPGVRLAESRERLSWPEVARLRVGLATALARPRRLLRFLSARGVTPCLVVSAPDHGSRASRALPSPDPGRPLDLWIATAKCAFHWSRKPWHGRRAPLAIIEHNLSLSPALVGRLALLGAP
jgi:tetraacyldisaccharide 4'-kinase